MATSRVWLRQLRRDRGLSQSQVAEAVGISPAYFADIERGVRRSSGDVALRISRFFDVPLERFFDEELDTEDGHVIDHS